MSYLLLDEYNVPDHELKISGGMPIKAADASGETSSTDEIDKGTKGKKLTVTLMVPFDKEADLRKLIRTAEAKHNGARVIYTITNQTANVAGIRQVRFAENISWEERDTLRAWDVSFTLKEYLSNPERVEQREAKAEPVEQTSDGIATTEERLAETAEATEEPLTGFEKVLSWMDEKLA